LSHEHAQSAPSLCFAYTDIVCIFYLFLDFYDPPEEIYGIDTHQKKSTMNLKFIKNTLSNNKLIKL
jgi:hypothetical protein